jgi:hypothetical protein
MRIFLKKIRKRIFKQANLPAGDEKEIATLPPGGYGTSVETSLNSRCCSDYDDDPELFHWGMFDPSKRLSQDTVRTVVQSAQICRFTNHRLEITTDENILTFIADNTLTGIQRNWAMIESGMQQQAVSLACAALGIGVVYISMDDNGTLLSERDLTAARLMIDAMKPSYSGSYWSKQSPTGRRAWLRGNLPDPTRESNTPLLQTLESLQINHHGGRQISDPSISQLLWAARGRTPHLYKSRPWGMTIPVSRGRQDTSSVYLLKNGQLFLYINQIRNRPTHSLQPSLRFGPETRSWLIRFLPASKCIIILAANELSGIAFCEIGYQLLNVLVQARALDLQFGAILLDDEQMKIGASKAECRPLAAVCLT